MTSKILKFEHSPKTEKPKHLEKQEFFLQIQKTQSLDIQSSRTCAYQELRNVCFSENLAGFVFLKHLFRDSSFCLITDESEFIRNIVESDEPAFCKFWVYIHFGHFEPFFSVLGSSTSLCKIFWNQANLGKTEKLWYLFLRISWAPVPKICPTAFFRFCWKTFYKSISGEVVTDGRMHEYTNGHHSIRRINQRTKQFIDKIRLILWNKANEQITKIFYICKKYVF